MCPIKVAITRNCHKTQVLRLRCNILFSFVLVRRPGRVSVTSFLIYGLSGCTNQTKMFMFLILAALAGRGLAVCNLPGAGICGQYGAVGPLRW